MSAQPSAEPSGSQTSPSTWIPPKIQPLTVKDIAEFRLLNIDQRDLGTLDFSSGKVTKTQDGDLFYSPNCSRPFEENIWPPPPFPLDPALSKIKEFKKPKWWSSPDTTYLAFIPEWLAIHTPPLDPLACDPPIRHNRQKGFFMDAKPLLQWNTLQKQLQKVAEDVQSTFRVPPQTRPFESALCCTGFFSTRKETQSRIELSRDWFGMWAALVSFNISVATLVTKDHLKDEDALPVWWQFLQNDTMHSQTFLSSLGSAGLGEPIGDGPVGVIINLLEPPEDQPTPDFYYFLGVPVWYPWGLKEMSQSINSTNLRRWAPPVEQLQKVATFFVVDPSDEKPWERWFQTCEKVRRERIAKETKKQKQQREGRERNHPVTKVKVFIWRRVDNVVQRFLAGPEDKLAAYGAKQKVYNSVANEWDCSTLFGDLEPEEERAIRLSDLMMPEQRHQTGTPDLAAGYEDLDQEMADYADFMGFPVQYPTEAPLEPTTSDITDSPSVALDPAPQQESAIPQEVERTEEGEIAESIPRPSAAAVLFQNLKGEYEWEEYELTDLLMKYFGFRPPSSIPENIQPPTEAPPRLLREVGAMHNLSVFKAPIATLAIRLWEFISEGKSSQGEPDYWDLHPTSNILRSSPRLRSFTHTKVPAPFQPRAENRPVPRTSANPPRRKKQKVNAGPAQPQMRDIWILETGTQQSDSDSWRLAVFDVLVVMMICRLPELLTQADILEELVNRGISCQVLQPYQGITLSLPAPVVSIPIRSGNYIFTQDDVVTYKAQARALLQNPRIARGAVLAGGILWRVALLFRVSIADVLHGQRESGNRSFAYPSTTPSYRFVGLHPQEGQVLCGLYHWYTKSPHPDKCSFLPLPETWKANICSPFWTPYHEDKFSTWMAHLDEVEAHQPQAQQHWANALRPSSTSRRAFKNVTEKSMELWGTLQG
ncbi:hypothetical protein CVT24_006409 [Panaeolus cyanescens]|uniref:Uncharacterized protein n=1 Tax=Panaeolus cyanescens TaxID=181874 RepID=A0A409WZC1_9AGAR|nr:hypothetical protein CVT24_006409 [Panaeolus cyanescens]